MALSPASFILGQTIVAYYTSTGTKVPALVEGFTSEGSPPVLALFVGPGQYHVTGVAYDSDGTQGTWNFDVAQVVVSGQTGEVGNQSDPSFTQEVRNAGIDEPELAFIYADDDETNLKVAGLEKTGTFATVRATRGSHFEGFSPDGVQEPTFRINSYPEGKCILEMGAGGSTSAVAGVVRAANVVTVTTSWPHGFSTGDTVNNASAITMSGAGGSVAAGDKTVTVTGATTFTFAQTAANGTSTNAGYWSKAVDVSVSREATNHLGFGVGGARKFSVYADSMTTEDGIRFATAGSLETSKIAATTTTPYTLAVEWGLLVNATAGAKVVNLPAASGCKGRQYFIKKTDAAANNVTITRAGSDTIDGATTLALTTQYNSALIVSDGVSAWHVISSKIG